MIEFCVLCFPVLCLQPALRAFEFIWAQVRGYAVWPGIIEEVLPNGKYRVHFFGDYTRCDMTRAKIMHAMEGFSKYATMKKPTGLLIKTVNETKFSILDTNRVSCPICDMLQAKDDERRGGK